MKNQSLIVICGKEKGYRVLKHLIATKETIAYIFCMKEDPHEKEQFSKEIVSLAKKYAIPIAVCKKISFKKHGKLFRRVKPTLLLVAGWRTIIDRRLIALSQNGAVALHESLLPKYRGFAPINWAVIHGERQTGVTLFYLDEGVDSGDVIGQEPIAIAASDTAFSVYKKTIDASLKLLKTHLPKILLGKAPRTKQNARRATYTAARIPEDGLIDWTKSSRQIYDLIRGLSDPYPGAYTFYSGKKLTIQKASFIKNPLHYVGRIPGRVVAIASPTVHVLTGDSMLAVETVEIEGKIVDASSAITSIKATLTNSR